MPSREFRRPSRSGKLGVFSAALAFLLTTGPSLAATLTVNSLADDTNSGDGLVTLREAIIAAVNDTTTDLGQTGTTNDTIDLTGLSGTISLTAPLPDVSNTITFHGPGPDTLSIDGGGVHTFLTLDTAATVNLNGLTISNFFRPTNGGAILTQGVLTASDCRFTGNRSSVTPITLNAMGSAIYGSGGGSSIALFDCIISHNVGEAVAPGPTVYFAGSAVGALNGTITVDRCTFDSNSTLYSGLHSSGGGMGNSLGVLGVGSIDVRDSTIKNGYFQQPPLSSYTGWGSVYVGSGARFTAQGSTWTGNEGNRVVCIYSISSAATPSPIQLLNCTFADNGSAESGTMFLLNGSVKLTLEHCTVAYNKSRAGVPASLDTIITSMIPQVQITNTVLANYDKAFDRPEIKNNAGTSISTNGYNFISNPDTVTFSQQPETYDSTGVTKVSELLNGLTDNGGHTFTCSLPDGSVLIDAANPTGFAGTDQRGVVRPRNGDQAGGSEPDIGAYERFDGSLKVTKTVNRTQAAVGNSLSYVLTVTNEHPNEPASGIEVTDILPPNLQFINTTASQFTDATYANGVLTAKQNTLPPGASVAVTVNCTVLPYSIENIATATQLAYEAAADDNVATAVTLLQTPPVPRVVSFTPTGPNPTSDDTSAFRLIFDRDITGLDESDFTIVPTGDALSIRGITQAGGANVYDIQVTAGPNDGTAGLELVDNDTIISQDDQQPLNGPGDNGLFASALLTFDRTAPVSMPIAAAVSPGETTTTKFFLLYSATDESDIAEVALYIRSGTSGAFQKVASGPLSDGIYEVDTAEYGSYGTYELYTVATDKAGNTESRVDSPQISVTLNPSTPTAALEWQLYD